MDTTNQPLAAVPPVAPVPLEQLVFAFGTAQRLRLLRELLHGGPLMNKQLAKRTGAHIATTSQHMRILLKAGLVRQGQASLYSIPRQYRDPNHPDQIDYGSCVLRLPKQTAETPEP